MAHFYTIPSPRMMTFNCNALILIAILSSLISLTKALIGQGNFYPVNCTNPDVQAAGAFAFAKYTKQKGSNYKIVGAFQKVCVQLRYYD